MKFVVLEGKHTEADGRVYKKGEMLQSELDLIQMFPNKFKTLDPAPETAESAPPGAEAAPTTAKAGKAGKKPETADAAHARGKDVTEDFPKAAEEGFKVFLRDKVHHVYEGDSTKPVNPRGLAKAEVEGFVKKYLEE